MCVVAWFAVADNLSRVRSMTLGALRELPVDVVTVGAIEGGMLAWIITKLPNLRRMAEKTGIFARALK